MASVVSVLLVEADARRVRARVEQRLMDGYEVDGVNAVATARVSSPKVRTRSCWAAGPR